ncbi:MAG TPA: esterase-like activity of phytase family protein [Povalibacter sp.]|nr:esterase-like activity of phytase family protein [Povalibacter sp.]
MLRNPLLAVAVTSVLSCSVANAAVELIATGTINGLYEDYSVQTAAPLESGIPGNRLGGIGSALAYAGCSTFLALPDRGPNALVYNAAVDSTTSYIPRFHTLHLSLAPSDAGAALPYVLTAFVTDTTLLSSQSRLFYGSGTAYGLGSGEPALNARSHLDYFSGRSDNFDPGKLSTSPNNGRFDPEGIRVANDGRSVYMTDEYGPYVYEFDRDSGRRLRAFKLPEKFAVKNQAPAGDAEISGNTSGRVANKGMEGLAITPDGRYLVGAMQSPLIQDGGTDAAFTRIVKIDTRTGAVSEYAYELTNIGSASKPKYGTISEILAINSHEFLVDERDGKGLGDNSTAVVKRVYRIDLANATEVSRISGAASLAGKASAKTLFLDVVAALTAHGINANDIPAKLEGLAFGPDITVDGAKKHTLFISNDNDYLGTVTDSNHPAGIDNPNRWFVFAVDADDLSGFVPQAAETNHSCSDDHRPWHDWSHGPWSY